MMTGCIIGLCSGVTWCIVLGAAVWAVASSCGAAAVAKGSGGRCTAPASAVSLNMLVRDMGMTHECQQLGIHPCNSRAAP
jgi:hypothetical protein